MLPVLSKIIERVLYIQSERSRGGQGTLGSFFNDNSRVVNYKKSKTEFLLFGHHQRLSKNTTVDIIMNGENISETEIYKYLGSNT